MTTQRSFPTSMGFVNTTLPQRAQWYRTSGSSTVCSRPTWQRLARLGATRQRIPVHRNLPHASKRLRVYNRAPPSDGAQRPEWIGQHALDAEPTLAAHLLGQDREPSGAEKRPLGDGAAEALSELRNTSEASLEKTIRETDSEARTFEASFNEQLAH
ncbi:hypothetical protein F1559_002515 [Cyanidiococcus yangmingshanensis]|uniref:Uncharacterized protein n=1 Tax=Cyanidiococcus yangmingshanensis TaxID=2690220 RepID=A0A7J7IBX6_9RHOD|nr:hypothetical protein F1559_002515 [Cyanidiococcus yangmingshanensis]